jgi:hypothetical protein
VSDETWSRLNFKRLIHSHKSHRANAATVAQCALWFDLAFSGQPFEPPYFV